MTIDLRSDTVTKPTKEMYAVMTSAELGDDVFGDDPTVNALEEKTAKMFGMEAALFCSTGTQTNQLAIRVHTRPGQEVVCDKLSHIYLFEGGGIALNAFSSIRTVDGNRGRITAQQVRENINNKNDVHQPVTSLVSLENTANKGGGSYYDFKEIENIRKACDEKGLLLHLDGARLFNALVETKETAQQYGKAFHSISICLSKGLGCPIGSLLLGNKDFIKSARRFRKVMGGGWRQAGIPAAAGIYALDKNINRLKEDHKRAKEIGNILKQHSAVKNIYPIDTNIVIFEMEDETKAKAFQEKAAANGIKCVWFGKNLVRFVTHLDFTDEHLTLLEKKLKTLL